MLKWLSKNKFQAHLTAFSLMIIASIGAIFSIRQEANALAWAMIVVFAVANLLGLLIK